ncbi:MAG: DNA-binding protein [Deltaproteobacteria bacterium]|nr:DNA-binding protein [Deltaproteobacteria bacterium]
MRRLTHATVAAGVSLVLVARITYTQPALAQPAAPPAGAAPAAAASTSGKVVETMDAGGYTYVQVDDGGKKIWAAAPKFAVAVGDQVVVPAGAPMHDFESKTLGRTFDVVYFVAAVQVAGRSASQPAAAHGAAAHAAPGQGAAPAALDLSNLKKAEGGHTVAELFANKAALAGSEVVTRGKVAKFTAQVMGKNWLHVQDGTGGAGTNDLTVTTSATAAVGNTVLVRGTLSTNKDFGYGYKYDIIIEDAAVAVE